eukprot:4680676-Amphidinium_carterae.1
MMVVQSSSAEVLEVLTGNFAAQRRQERTRPKRAQGKVQFKKQDSPRDAANRDAPPCSQVLCQTAINSKKSAIAV